MLTMEVNNIKVFNFVGALKGMRAPFKAYDKTDSTEENGIITLGARDKERAFNLCRAGAEHRKFLRQILVSCEILAPRFWWHEWETYTFTTSNSESTMHTLLAKPLTIEDFAECGTCGGMDMLKDSIRNINARINWYKQEISEEVKYDIWRDIIVLLPQSYLQRRFITTNYEVLLNVIRQRKSHKLEEWHDLVDEFVENCPFLAEFAKASGVNI